MKLHHLAIVALTLTACGSKSSDTEVATSLLNKATTACNEGRYDEAVQLLDSINRAYPHEIDVRRQALLLQPKVAEAASQQQLLDNRSETDLAQKQLEALMPFFNTYASDGKDRLEGYYEEKSTPANFRSRNTIVARVNQAGEFVVISSVTNNTAHHTAVTLTDAASGTSATSGTVAYRGNPDKLSTESVRFTGELADTIGAFCSGVGARSLRLDFAGTAKIATTLSASEVAAIGRSWELSRAITRLQMLQSQRERLEAKVQLSRDQQARQQAD